VSGGVLVWMAIWWVVRALVCGVVGWSGVVEVWFGGVCVSAGGVVIGVVVAAVVDVGVSVVVASGGVLVVVFVVVRVGVVASVGWVVLVWPLSL
jgi:hypothetical protein